MKNFFFMVIIFFILSTYAKNSYGNNTDDKNNPINTLRIVSENLPPIHTVDENGKLSGAIIDVIDLLLKKTNIDAPIEILPWARAYQIGLERENTLIFSMFREKTREDQFQWIGNLLTINSYLVALKTSKNIKINTMEDAKKHSIGSIRQDLAEHYLKTHGFKEKQNLYLSSDYKMLWKLLFNGRTDLVFTNDILWEYELRDVGLDPSKVQIVYKIPAFASDLYFAASLGTDEAIVSRLSKALADIKASGEYLAILKKWHISPL